MKIECEHCLKKYNIPDERIPPEKGELKIRCPNCHGPIRIHINGTDDLDSPNCQVLKEKILLSLTGVLPPMPQVVLKAQEKLSDPKSSLKELGNLIATDQAMSVRTLKMANSAYYGLKQNVTSIGHATVLLGSKVLGEIIVMAGISSVLPDKLKGYGLGSGELWRHSLAAGIGARMLANKVNPDISNDAFTAGLIHDAGKIMLDEHILAKKTEFDLLLKDKGQTHQTAEKRILGIDHAEIGAAVCKTWGIPETIIYPISYHHHPSDSDGDELAYIISLADFIAIKSGFGAVVDNMTLSADADTTKFLKLEDDDIDHIVAEVIQSVEVITERISNDA